MSLTVKVQSPDGNKTLYLERSNLRFSALAEKLEAAYSKPHNTFCVVGDGKHVNSDSGLVAVVEAAEHAGAAFLQLRIVGLAEGNALPNAEPAKVVTTTLAPAPVATASSATTAPVVKTVSSTTTTTTATTTASAVPATAYDVGRDSDPFLVNKQRLAATRGVSLKWDRRYKIVFQTSIQTNYGEKLFVCGNVKGLGDWKDARARRMDFGEGVWRTFPLEVTAETNPLEYRFFKLHDATKSVKWEKVAKRVFELPDRDITDAIVLEHNDIEFD